MKNVSLHLCAILLLVLPVGTAHGVEKANAARKPVSAVPLSGILKASRRVDALIEAGYKQHKVQPNPPADDAEFLRRVTLDIVGRIPTYAEANAFLNSRDPRRRSKLIDRLLEGEGYVSHHFNWWADLLRIQSRMRNARYASADPYIDFVKQSLRENKPYDQFVRELITAQGYIWDNGAVGYYLRDWGMPLDNMSNTAQVFLGTQLVCAQCHDHPFDSWTQKQYYQMAAFTYGVDTYTRTSPRRTKLRQMHEAGKIDRELYLATIKILQPLMMLQVKETGRVLRLPRNYQYSNGKAGANVIPATIFGDSVTVETGKSRAEAYARWMTSPNNPRFTKVIANRLWKRAMGVGLIEPVDDLKDGTKASNPELMKYLVEQMIALQFDLKQFQRILFNTKTYQRQVSLVEVGNEPYHFPGPVLRRMSAEQAWDSLLTLIIPDADERKSLLRRWYYARTPELVKMSVPELLKVGDQYARVRRAHYKLLELSSETYQQYLVARRVNDLEKARKLSQKLEEYRKQVFTPELMKARQEQQGNRAPHRETDPRWIDFSRDWVRASELDSPAPPAHFLRLFGQSDRETIENSNRSANVPQILTLINGPVFAEMMRPQSVLSKALAEANGPDEKVNVIFLSIVSRMPTDRERKLALAQLKTGEKGTGNVIWALLTTRRFLFIQ